MSLDESEAYFKKADATLTRPEVLAQYAGKYNGGAYTATVELKNDGQLYMLISGMPTFTLLPVKARNFAIKQKADWAVEFSATGNMVVKIPGSQVEFQKQ